MLPGASHQLQGCGTHHSAVLLRAAEASTKQKKQTTIMALNLIVFGLHKWLCFHNA